MRVCLFQVLMIATSGINVANVYKQYGSSVEVLQVITPLSLSLPYANQPLPLRELKTVSL